MPNKHVWNWKKALVGRAKKVRRPFPTLADVEREHIATVLHAYGNNLAHAAQALQISRSTLYRKLQDGESVSQSRRAR